MALSNMRKEPRREITETLVGFGWVAGMIGLDYAVGLGFRQFDSSLSIMESMFVGFLALTGVSALIALILGGFLLTVIHEIGDAVCGFLERRGVQMRPRQRY